MSTKLVTIDSAKVSLNLSLTKVQLGVQQINDAESKLVYNEDNLDEIRKFIENARKAAKSVEDERVLLKAPYFEAGKAIDAAAKDIVSQFSPALERAVNKLTQISKEIEAKRLREHQEKARVDGIKNGINANLASFSQSIAACETSQQLIDIERRINLEKANKNKYAEFYDEAVASYSTLNAILTTQKEKVRELEDAKAQLEAAKVSDDDEKIIQLTEKVESVAESVELNKVKVQDAAFEIQTSPEPIPETQTVFPTVKARRTTWKWEVVDLKETAKKMPDWVVTSANDTHIDAYLKAKRAEGLNGQTEFTTAGIRFYEEKTY